MSPNNKKNLKLKNIKNNKINHSKKMGSSPENNGSSANMGHNSNYEAFSKEELVGILTNMREEMNMLRATILAIESKNTSTNSPPTKTTRSTERKRRKMEELDERRAQTNQYEMLNDDNMQDNDDNISVNSDANDATNDTKYVRSSNATRQFKQNTLNEVNNQRNKKNNVPPIYIFNESLNDISNYLQQKLKIANFAIKKINAGKIALTVNDIDDYYIAKTKLNEERIANFSFTPNLDKNKTFILRGLDGNENPDDILDGLKSLNVNNVQFVKVTQFSTPQSVKNGILLPLFLVQITAKSEESQLMKIDKLNRIVVKWEKLKHKESSQCRRCQRMGHTAVNCNMPYRCVKCNDDHEPGQCKLNQNQKHDLNQLFCVSCNEFGHPASYRGCPKIKEFALSVQNRKNQRNLNRDLRIQAFNDFIRPGASFANVVNSQNSNQRSRMNSRSNHASGDNSSQSNFNNDLKRSILSAINEMIDTKLSKIYKSFNDHSRQINLLLDACGINNRFDG